MKLPLVITSINPPTKAIKEFARQNLDVIVVGDKKTPSEWKVKGVKFLSLEEQQNLAFEIVKKLPVNNYSRKNIGYLYAMKLNPEKIIDSDDDNIPYENWGSYFNLKSSKITTESQGFVNVYSYFTEEFIWPRGLPLDELRTKPVIEGTVNSPVKIGMYQGLANQDPDVDAIYRLVISKYLNFDQKPPLILSKGTIAPINTQNTITDRKFFSLMYLPSYVGFRFSDILRGLIAQPIMWLYDYYVGFFEASVYQDRNPHDLMKDFSQEIECYLFPKKIISIVSGVIDSKHSVEKNLQLAYESLVIEGILDAKELGLLELWLLDLKSISLDNDLKTRDK
jgi:hypothetical protein